MAHPTLYFCKLTPRGNAPTRGTMFSAGFDLYAAYDTVIPPYGKQLCYTDISILCPYGTYGRIASRSSVATNHFVSTAAGVIDPDYRGNIGVLLYNFSNQEFIVKRKQRIAQLILEKFVSADVEEVKTLPESLTRGVQGFGSTGE